LLVAILFFLCFLKQTETIRSEKFSELADARKLAPVDPSPATITAVLAMHPWPLSAAERLCFKPLRLR
jgi:hypothetical protein